MKLTSVFNQEILEEGLKFGNREMRMVDKMAKDIYIGCEYEYHVHKELLQTRPDDFGDDDIIALADEVMHRDIQRQKKEWTDDYIDNEMGAWEVEEGLIRLNDIKSTHGHIEQDLDALVNVEDEFQQIMKEFGEIEDAPTQVEQTMVMNYMKGISHIYSALHNIQDDITHLEKDEQLDMWIHIISGGAVGIATDLESTKTELIKFKDYAWDLDLIAPTDKITLDHYFQIKEVIREHGVFELYPIQTWLDQVQALYGNDQSWSIDIITQYRREGEEIWNDRLSTDPEVMLGYDRIRGHIPQQFWNYAVAELSGNGENDHLTADDYVKYITNQIQNHDVWGIKTKNIQRVETEAGIEDGVETITKPLKFHDALALNEKMFAHIRDVGWTDEGTGLHVNMSLKGLNFNRDNFNTSKLLLLLKPKMLQEFFGLRSYIDDQFDGLTDNKVFVIAKLYSKKKSLSTAFEAHAFKRIKHQQINLEGFADHVDRQRIEFRYVGGKDYEKRQNTIEWHIYRMAYITMCAFAEDFGHKEYLKEIFRVLDERSKDYNMGMAFTDLVEWCKHHPESNFNDFSQDVLMDNRPNQTRNARINAR